MSKIFKVQGTVHAIEDIETFQARNGQTYRKQTLVLVDRDDRGYDHYMTLKVFGEAVEETEDLRNGENVSVTFTIEAREYNGKWYNDVNLVHARRTAPVVEDHRAAAHAKVEAILNGTAPVAPEDDLPE